jgi:tetratricopeptide (TPR) repeat protein
MVLSNGTGARLAAIQAALARRDIPTAGTLAEDALKDGIEHAMVLSVVAARREAEGRFGEALALLQRAKAASPGAVGILNAIGLSLTRVGRFADALAEYDRALAIDPKLAKALANRGMALTALMKLNDARRDFEAAAAIDPGNLIAANGLAALALRRGEAGEARRLALQVLARRPGFPGAVMTLAGADIAEARTAEAASALRGLSGDERIAPMDRAIALGLLGDALDIDEKFAEAFAAWRDANALLEDHYRADHEGRQGTLALVRDLTAALEAKSIPAPRGHGAPGPPKRHVFLVGFPRSGTTLIEQVLEQHPEITTMAEKECLTGAAREWMIDAGRFEAFLAAPEAALEPFRAAYWKRVAEEGADPAGRVFVDKHPFNTFRLPLIARLFPDALVLFARRDPRDIVLSCFRHRFQMADPVYEMLTLEGTAALYAATMELAQACEAAFSLVMHPTTLEAIIADFDGETKAICDYIGVEWHEALRDFSGQVGTRGVFTPSGPQLALGLNARGVGKWRDYEAEMAAVLPVLAPWVERFEGARGPR